MRTAVGPACSATATAASPSAPRDTVGEHGRQVMTERPRRGICPLGDQPVVQLPLMARARLIGATSGDHRTRSCCRPGRPAQRISRNGVLPGPNGHQQRRPHTRPGRGNARWRRRRSSCGDARRRPPTASSGGGPRAHASNGAPMSYADAHDRVHRPLVGVKSCVDTAHTPGVLSVQT